MLYLWEVTNAYPDKLYASYERLQSLDSYKLIKGRRISHDEFQIPAPFEVEGKHKDLSKWDCLLNNASSLLVSKRVQEIFMRLAPEEVQFLKTSIACEDAVITDYCLLNITNEVNGLDHEKSAYYDNGVDDAIMGFDYVSYKPDCLGKHHIARDAEYHGHILVSEELKQAFEAANITGYSFEIPEEVYARIRGEIE